MANSVFLEPSSNRPELVLRNTITPRILSPRRAHGLMERRPPLWDSFRALQHRFPRIGYIKPVGQRFVEIEGAKIDEDTVLINDTYHPHTPLPAQ